MRLTHITSRPNHEVGDKLLGLCGKEFKVKILWDDVPKKNPICRTCIDMALTALDEADALIERARRRNVMLALHMERLTDELEPDLLLLDSIAERDREHREEREQKAKAKRDKVLTKGTCTCFWENPEDYKMDPACPIHGDAVGDVSDPKDVLPTPGSVQRNGDEPSGE